MNPPLRPPHPHPPLPAQEPNILPPLYHPLSPTLSKWAPLLCTDIHALRTHGVYEVNTPRELFYFGDTNHPVKWLRVVGVVVGVDEFGIGGGMIRGLGGGVNKEKEGWNRGKVVYTLDDGSGGACECVCPGPASSTRPITAVSNTARSKTSANTTTTSAHLQKPTTTDQPSTDNPLVPYGLIDIGTVLKIKGKPGVYRGVHQVEIIKAEILRGTEQEVKCWDEMLAFRREVLDVPWVVSREEGEKCRRRAEREVRGRKAKHGEKDRHGKNGEVERGKGMGREGGKDEGRGGREEDRKKKRAMEKDKDKEGLDPGNKVNYPSLAVRRRAKGKYDALGI